MGSSGKLTQIVINSLCLVLEVYRTPRYYKLKNMIEVCFCNSRSILTRTWTFIGILLSIVCSLKQAVKYWRPFFSFDKKSSLNSKSTKFFPQDLLCCVKLMLFKLKYTALDKIEQVALHSMYSYLLSND